MAALTKSGLHWSGRGKICCEIAVAFQWQKRRVI